MTSHRALALIGTAVTTAALIAGCGTAPSTPGPTSGGPVLSLDATTGDTTAAAVNQWGAPGPGSDDFTDGGVDPTRWDVYDGDGHAGNGTRSPDAVAVRNGVLTITGDAEGTTGGVANRTAQQYGRWEVRMRAAPRPGASDGDPYHPVLLLWPANAGGSVKPGGTGGEIDFAETDVGSGQVSTFLHPPTSDADRKAFRQPVDLSQWHNYAVEWTPTRIAGWIDGQQWYDVTDPVVQPGGPMTPCVQLDANTPSGLQPAVMETDWIHIYPPPPGPD
ncbi:glycoside hydrolase family 16 protein [Actinomycetospora rhizophila]|uniref:Glycoside hydrolase family 16 protein n=1 Tax=Actinomycetospora rhizophila TaxID=1416876 RepID=A0ABV9ZFM3_9PSEU